MKQHNASGRYALLDELRGLDLVSMMLYHGCWDLVNLFGIQANWYYGLPGHLWQQSICWVFILLSGFCVQLGHHTLRRGAQVFGAGALVTAVTLLFMPEDRVVFGVLTLLGSAMLADRPFGKAAAAHSTRSRVCYLRSAVCPDPQCFGGLSGFWQFAPLAAADTVCKLRYSVLWILSVVVLFYGLFRPSAVAVSVLGRVLSLRCCRAAAHGALAPLGLPAAGLAWAALAAAVSAAPAGHLWGATGGVPRIGQLKRTLCVLQKRRHCCTVQTLRQYLDKQGRAVVSC